MCRCADSVSRRDVRESLHDAPRAEQLARLRAALLGVQPERDALQRGREARAERAEHAQGGEGEAVGREREQEVEGEFHEQRAACDIEIEGEDVDFLLDLDRAHGGMGGGP